MQSKAAEEKTLVFLRPVSVISQSGSGGDNNDGSDDPSDDEAMRPQYN